MSVGARSAGSGASNRASASPLNPLETSTSASRTRKRQAHSGLLAEYARKAASESRDAPAFSPCSNSIRTRRNRSPGCSGVRRLHPQTPIAAIETNNQLRDKLTRRPCRPAPLPNHRRSIPFPRAASQVRAGSAELQFGKIDLPELRHHNDVSVSAQLRTSGLDVLYQRTQHDPFRFRKLIAGEPVIPLPEKFRYVRLWLSPQESPLHHFPGLLVLQIFLLEGCMRSQASEKFIVQIYLNRAPGDPQILEAASDRKNRRLLLVQTLLGGNARDDAIRGHHVENVQPLDRRGYRGVKGVILRVAAGASHRIRRFVRNDFH